MLNSQQIEELMPAFDGIETDDGNLPAMLRKDMPSGCVVLTSDEIELVAQRILELQEIVRQNALVA